MSIAFDLFRLATVRATATVASGVFALAVLTLPAWSQTSPRQDAPSRDKPPMVQPERRGDKPADKSPQDAPAKPPARQQLGKTIPDAPADRAKLLDDLYAHLATAPDEAASKPYADAIERLWLASGSDTVSVLMERALQASKHDRNDLALQLLSSVVELSPDYAEGWNRRAYVFYTEGDYERALGDLRRVLALDPNHYKALDGLGQIMRQLDRKRQALQTYEKLQQVNPNWPNVNNLVDELRRDVEGRGL